MPRPLTIAYVGNFQPDVVARGHRPWSTETQVAETLEAMGHEVLRLQESPAMDWRVVAKVGARAADLLLWTQTWQQPDAAALPALAEIRTAGTPTASFHLDLYFGLRREAQIGSAFWRTDHVFTADGHPRPWAERGVNHHWLPPAIHEPDAVTGTPGDQRWPVIFVGSVPYPHPEHDPARRALIVAMQRRYGPRFRLWRGGVRGAALADLYASADVIVGDSCMAGRIERYWSDRIPETLGRRGFLVHPHVPGIEEHYKDGEHLRTFEAGDVRQAVAVVDWALDHPEERARIAAAGQAKVRDADTYRHRMTAVLETIFGPEDDW